jgi:hypothetical protein
LGNGKIFILPELSLIFHQHYNWSVHYKTLNGLKESERMGFEPMVQKSLYNNLASCRFKPLSHLSLEFTLFFVNVSTDAERLHTPFGEHIYDVQPLHLHIFDMHKMCSRFAERNTSMMCSRCAEPSTIEKGK